MHPSRARRSRSPLAAAAAAAVEDEMFGSPAYSPAYWPMSPSPPRQSPRALTPRHSPARVEAAQQEARSIHELVQNVVRRSPVRSPVRSPGRSPRYAEAQAEIERLRAELAAAAAAPRPAPVVAPRRRRSPKLKGPAPIPGNLDALDYNTKCAYKMILFFEKEWPTLGPELMKLGKKATGIFFKKYAPQIVKLREREHLMSKYDFEYDQNQIFGRASKETFEVAGEKIGDLVEQYWTEDSGLCFRPARFNDVIFADRNRAFIIYETLAKSTKRKFNRQIADEFFFQ